MLKRPINVVPNAKAPRGQSVGGPRGPRGVGVPRGPRGVGVLGVGVPRGAQRGADLRE
jgi:hypothetical protein